MPEQAGTKAFRTVNSLTAGARIERSNDACLSHTDGLLLHHLVQLHTGTGYASIASAQGGHSGTGMC